MENANILSNNNNINKNGANFNSAQWMVGKKGKNVVCVHNSEPTGSSCRHLSLAGTHIRRAVFSHGQNASPSQGNCQH